MGERLFLWLGVSAYYGFPWWYVGVGPDNIARSLFHAISLMAIFIVAWGAGIFLFFVVKRKTHINDLSFLRLFWQLFYFSFQLLLNSLS